MANWLKTALIGVIIFFGSSFSIMAFHNDIGLVDLFAQIYEQVIGYAPGHIGGLEIGYSIGLAAGILVFFNHFSLKKRENDPTPLQVEMSKYEQDIEDTIERISKKEQQENKNPGYAQADECQTDNQNKQQKNGEERSSGDRGRGA